MVMHTQGKLSIFFSVINKVEAIHLIILYFVVNLYIANSLINKNKVLILHHISFEQSLNPRGKVLTGDLKMPCQHCCCVFNLSFVPFFVC